MAWLYDWECRYILHRTDQDISFWLAAARHANGPVLELACGTGRITLPLAEAGVAIVGLDRNLAMLAVAAQKAREAAAAAPVNAPHEAGGGHRPAAWPLLVAADMRRFTLAARFGLVFVGYNSLQLLSSPADMAACLSRAREHLAPGALVGVEVTDFQVGAADGQGPEGEPLGEAEGVQLAGTLVHDLATRTSRYLRRFTGDGWAVEDEVIVRSVDRRELCAVLEEAGLTPTWWWQAGPTLWALAAPGDHE